MIDAIGSTVRSRRRTVAVNTEGNMYLGFVFAVGDQAAAVIAALRRAELALRFTIAPLL
ncbi:MAG: hypothetical protein NT062_36250 [Proteobacteria bacterium]|nr:hypothetical protein [Pseudomonadota bacterium]